MSFDLIYDADKRSKARTHEEEVEASRLQIVFISDSELIEFFRNRAEFSCLSVAHFPELPDGYEVRGVAHDFMRRGLLIKCWHQTFDPVPMGTEVPIINRKVETLISVYRKVED